MTAFNRPLEYDALRGLWPLDSEITYLNHGSFGATPWPVLKEQDHWRFEMEKSPVNFLFRKRPGILNEQRLRLASYVKADPQGTVFVSNATMGVNSVLHSLKFAPGDEILVSNHGYPAVRQSLRHLESKTGVGVVEAVVPFPLSSHDDVVRAFEEKISKKTRLVIVDHITSATALIFPVKRIIELAHAHDVPVLVDGAHAPGMIPLEIEKLKADFYTGNLHKWVCAPKGAAFLYVARKYRDVIRPLSMSHFYNEGLFAEFDWTGTHDPSPWLSVGSALDFLQTLGGTRLQESNHALARAGGLLVAEALSTQFSHPDDAAYYGSMASFVLPFNAPASAENKAWLAAHFYRKHRIEVLISGYDERILLRISAQAYNRLSDYEKLVEALKKKDYL